MPGHKITKSGKTHGASRGKKCDRCGRRISKKAVRYIAKIQVYAAYDPLEITSKDLLRDHTEDIERLLKQCEQMTEEELMRDVYVDFEFNLCSPCQKIYVANPLRSNSIP
jgi:hypothetical protein